MALTKKQKNWWKLAISVFLFEFITNILFTFIVTGGVEITASFLILSAVVTIGLIAIFKWLGLLNKRKC